MSIDVGKDSFEVFETLTVTVPVNAMDMALSILKDPDSRGWHIKSITYGLYTDQIIVRCLSEYMLELEELLFEVSVSFDTVESR